MDFFVAATLLLLAAALLLEGRRRSENGILSFFLLLVGINFFGLGMADLSGEPRWSQVAYVALALDPFFLLYFVTIYPYRRPSRLSSVVLAVMGAVAAVSIMVTLLAPERIIRIYFGADPLAPERLLLVGGLGLGYVTAWFHAVRTYARAPSNGLARRAAWVVGPVGVAILPRLAVLHTDLSLSVPVLAAPTAASETAFWVQSAIASFLVEIAILGLLLLLGWRIAGRAECQEPVCIRRNFLLIGGISLALLGTQALFVILVHLVQGLGYNVPFGLRWLVFAAMLAYGVLAYQILEFHRSSREIFATGLALLGAFALALLVFYGFQRADRDPVLGGTMAASFGLAAIVPLATLARRVLLRFDTQSNPLGDRRLQLYRAALEVAWANGPPSEFARKRLAEEREEFRVTLEEARVLAQVVADNFRRRENARQPGDELLPGILVEEQLGRPESPIYLARRLPEALAVVVREIPSTDSNASGRTTLMREFQALKRLRHPLVPRVLDVAASPGGLLLVREHVDGTPLSRALREGPPPPPARLIADLLDILSYVHSRRILHCDIKPDNIILDAKGRVHLTDFGVARDRRDAVRATMSALGNVGGLEGTPLYMAPEQVTGGPVTPASDLYAVGLVAYEALTGRPARPADSGNLYETLTNAAHASVDLTRVPPGWRRLLAKALRPDPKKRFQSAPEMRAALDEIGPSPGRPGRRAASVPHEPRPRRSSVPHPRARAASS